jgi:hypothetical protein
VVIPVFPGQVRNIKSLQTSNSQDLRYGYTKEKAKQEFNEFMGRYRGGKRVA